jgi:ubiquinone/menaquinone biosynthesis C-methylase UbiE
MNIQPDEVIQQARYTQVAADFESLHADIEHIVALSFLTGMLDFAKVKSVLDVGAGTGRAMHFLQHHRPELRIVGVEPVEALRRVAYEKGIPPGSLIEGNGYELPFRDGEFDLVCEVGVLHHVRHPSRVLAEMLRVGAKGIFLSDSNNFGGGSGPGRLLKQSLRALRLWPLVQFVTTRGKGYHITAGDGLHYSYSVFNNLEQIRRVCPRLYMLNTSPAGPNLYRSATHIALLALR